MNLSRPFSQSHSWLLALVMCMVISMVGTPNLAGEELPPPVKLPPQVKVISAEEFAAQIAADNAPALLDMRGRGELLKEGYIAGALQKDYFSHDLADWMTTLKYDKARPLYIYCAIQGRSLRTAVLAAKEGFTDIRVLQHGFVNWKKQGRPVTPGQ